MMMCGSLPLLLVALSTALAAPSPPMEDQNSQQIIVPQKRAALVLDRLLVALQKALHEDSQPSEPLSREWPRTAPLRIDMDDVGDMQQIVPQKRATLVLYRLLVALQKALHEDSQPSEPLSREWPRTEPLRIDMVDFGDMRDHYEEVKPLSYELERAFEPAPAPAPRLLHDDVDTSGLQRRGQAGAGRGRVLRCYFNAVTCF